MRSFIKYSNSSRRIIDGNWRFFAHLLALLSISLLGLSACAYTRGPGLQARHDIGNTLCENDVSRPGTEVIHVAPGQLPRYGDVAEDNDSIVWASALATTESEIATVIKNDICMGWRLECGAFLGCIHVPDSSIRRPCKLRKEIPVRDVFGIGKVPAVRLDSSGWDEAMAYAEQLALQACTHQARQSIRQSAGELEDPGSLDCKLIQQRFCD